MILLNFVCNIADKTQWSITRRNIYLIIYVFVYFLGFAAESYMNGDYTADNYIAVGYITIGYKLSEWLGDFQNLV